MTTLLTLCSIIGLIAICWCISKYNKDDNLFWILLISLFGGMAGGAIFSKLSNDNDEEESYFMQTTISPTQALPANSIGFYTQPAITRAFNANPVGKELETSARDNKICFALSLSDEEIRGQPAFTLDSS